MKLAINGGKPVTTINFPSQLNMDKAELMMVVGDCMDNGLLTGYQANSTNFYGGPMIQDLENLFRSMYHTKHAIPCNSCTSALHIACMAIGLKPGDEVIVSPYTMTCSATAPMLCGAVPVFADIEKDFYCLDPESIEEKITPKTKAIIVVDIFGQPHNVKAIQKIAKEHNLFVIEDAAQAIGSQYGSDYAGTFGDIGCFSFNQGKHISAGEGGMLVTDHPVVALKCRLLMNHAESVVNEGKQMGWTRSVLKEVQHMWGFNMRMTEITAAITLNQLRKFNESMKLRQANVNRLNKILSAIPTITPSPIRPGCTHTHYAQSFTWDMEVSEGIHRNEYINAVKAELTPISRREKEGVPIGNGYIKPLYRFPIFDKQKPRYLSNVEHLWMESLFLMRFCAPPTTIYHCNLVGEAFQKVWNNRDELRH